MTRLHTSAAAIASSIPTAVSPKTTMSLAAISRMRPLAAVAMRRTVPQPYSLPIDPAARIIARIAPKLPITCSAYGTAPGRYSACRRSMPVNRLLSPKCATRTLVLQRMT